MEIAGEGRIVYVNDRIWRLGDGLGRFMDLDLNTSHSSGTGSQISVAPKMAPTRRWPILARKQQMVIPKVRRPLPPPPVNLFRCPYLESPVGSPPSQQARDENT